MSEYSSGTDGESAQDPDSAVEPSSLPLPIPSGSVEAADGSAIQEPDLPEAQSVPDRASKVIQSLLKLSARPTISGCLRIFYGRWGIFLAL